MRWMIMAVAAALLAAPARAGGDEAAPDVPADTLAAIRARGELVWGADSVGGAPYVFQDPMDPNHLIGFEVDLADAPAAQVLGDPQHDATRRLVHAGAAPVPA